MIVLPITLKAFETLDSKPIAKKARLEFVFHSLPSRFFFHKGEGLECARVNRWLTPKMRSHAFFALDSESSQQKGMSFLQLESNGVRSTSLKASSGVWGLRGIRGATSPNSSPLVPLKKKALAFRRKAEILKFLKVLKSVVDFRFSNRFFYKGEGLELRSRSFPLIDPLS